MIWFKRHFSFLYDVLIYTLTAFGGPQAHLGMMNRIFVEKRKDLTEQELLDYFGFCQLLPGASSTQLLSLVAYKRGGVILSIFTLFIWLLPAGLIMGLFSFYVSNDINKTETEKLFHYFPAMTIGFLIYTGWSITKSKLNDARIVSFVLLSTIISFIFFKSPWIFPVLLISGGLINNFLLRSVNPINKRKVKKPNSVHIIIFLLLFFTLGFLSESARKQNWSGRSMFNLAENFYRFGSIVFGGGDVLLPMIVEQYVARPTDKRIIEKNPNSIKLTKEEVLIGYGVVKAIPGPVFSIGSYIGGISMKKQSTAVQILGCIVGAISLFLPGILLLFFFFPLWEYGKQFTVLQKAAEGIKWVAVGFIWSGAAFIFADKFEMYLNKTDYIELLFIILIPVTLSNTKIQTPFIVILTMLLGLFY